MQNRALGGMGLVCLFLAGCIQMEQTFTLNPDGSGKVTIVMVSPLNPLEQMFAMPAGPDTNLPTIERKKRAFVQRLLDSSKGVDAWKDVSAEYTPEGLLKFQGTAYFKDLEHFKVEGSSASPAKLVREADGSLRLVFATEALRNNLNQKKPEDPRDPRKLNNKELDEYILGKRIEYQSMKPLLSAMLTDLKFKYIFRLPGEVSGVKVYRPEGKRAVSFELDGNKFLKAINKVAARDNAFFRKLLRTSGQMEVLGQSPEGLKLLGLDWHEARATVAKVSGPQFDYAKEADAARAAYPALRKRLGLGEEKKIPDFPEFKRDPPGPAPKELKDPDFKDPEFKK
jgi:hypothetical protein